MAEIIVPPEFQRGDRRLKGGGNDGTSGDMEARVSALETDMREIKTDLHSLSKDVGEMKGTLKELSSELKTLIRDVAETKGKVSQLPTTMVLLGFMVTVAVAAGLVRHFFP